jgi:hypothetical protein
MATRRTALPHLPEQKDRLKWAREQAGIKNPTEAARRFGWSVNTYRSNENGNRAFGKEAAIVYGTAFKVSPGWLLLGDPDQPPAFISYSSGDRLEELDKKLNEILALLKNTGPSKL